MNNFAATHYLLSYRYGVSSRGFVATILDFLITETGFISKRLIWNFIASTTLLMVFFIRRRRYGFNTPQLAAVLTSGV